MTGQWLTNAAALPALAAVALLVEPVRAGPVAEVERQDKATDCTAGPMSAEIQPDVLQAIAVDVSRHWNLDGSDADVMSSSVTVRVCFWPGGMPADFELVDSSGPSQAGIDKLYASARRAVIRAHVDGGLPLPMDNYDAWRVIDLVFAANEMKAR